jgi:tRNA modification GTPase
MVEAHQPVGETDNLIYKKIRRKPLIVTVNKIDLVHADPLDGIPEHWRKHPQAPISALNGDGIEELKDRIVDICRAGDAVDVQTDIIPNVRHRALLDRSLQAAEAIRKGINDGIPLELVAIHLQESVTDLGKILGIDAKVDVLENIFSRFCVGK